MSQQQKEFSKADFAAAEREAHQVNNEQVIAAALFAKQLQSDLVGIKKAQVGEGLRIPNVDMSKVMPSEIYKSFRPVGGMPRPQPRPQPPVQQAPAPVQQTYVPPPSYPETGVPISIPTQPVFVPAPVYTNPQPETNKDQLEFNFNKVTRYEDVIEAIEKLENKVNTINEKLDLLLQDKKKLKKTTLNGTQAG